jgi:hypothetical protein
MGILSSDRTLEPARHPRRNGKLFGRKRDGNRDFSTIIETVCGGERVLIPGIICKASDLIDS